MAFKDYGTGRCINCGFLGKRSPEIDEVCFHASENDRIYGLFNRHHTFMGGESTLSTMPWCFAVKADYNKELRAAQVPLDHCDQVRKFLARDRQCPSWYPWREFATPKEHFDEQMTIVIEQRRKDFEEKMELRRQGFDLKMENDRRAWEKELTDNYEKERKRTDKIIIGLAFLGVVVVIVQIVMQ